MTRVFTAIIILLHLASPLSAAELIKHATWKIPGSKESALAFVIGGNFSVMEDKGLKSIALISGRAKLDDIAWKLGGYVAKQYIVAPGDYSIEVLKSGSVITITAKPKTIHYIGFSAIDPVKNVYEIDYLGDWSSKAHVFQPVKGFMKWTKLSGKGLVTYIKETKTLDPTYKKLGLQLKPIWPIPPAGFT